MTMSYRISYYLTGKNHSSIYRPNHSTVYEIERNDGKLRWLTITTLNCSTQTN